MSLVVSQPTSNQTPDATLGGLAVTSPTNTGHGSTSVVVIDGATQSKSCRWFAFQAVAGVKTAITLKIDHTSDGSLTGTASNVFRVQYTLNGGGAWTTAVERLNFTSPQGPTTFSVALSAAQDISQVQVRVFYQASTGGVGDAANMSATIANIKLEVTTQDQQVIVMMNKEWEAVW